MTKLTTQARLDNLLTLRVLATLAVVFGHSASFFQGFTWSQHPPGPYIQSQAVTVFFLVSGYTIAWVCDRDLEKGRSFFAFVFDRAVRLLVPLLPILLLAWMLEAAAYNPHPYADNLNLKTLVGNLVFLQSVDIGGPGFPALVDPRIGPFGTNRPLWTISLEFWLYVAFAAAFFSAKSRGQSLILIPILVFAILVIHNEWFGGRSHGLPLTWLFGAYIYRHLKDAQPATQRQTLVAVPLAALISFLLFSPVIWPTSGTYSLPYNFTIAAAFSLFIWLCPAMPNRWTAWMSWGGSFAYTAYLAHYPILYFLWDTQTLPNGNLGALIGAIVSLFVSYLLGLLFERHYKTVRHMLLRKLRGVII